MKQEDKELLFKDLCARLPYGVECFVHGDCDSTLTGIVNDRCYFENLDWEMEEDDGYRDIDSGWVQPYLRPMSSMTEEERKDFYDNLRPKCDGKPWESMGADADWLNAHHFDYRGLIPKGLALEAPEGMYK